MTELDKVQLETAQVELALKRKELADRNSWLRTITGNPAVAAAIAAAFAGGIFGLITASFQARTEKEKYQEQLNSTILIDTLPRVQNISAETLNAARRLKIFLDAGILTDETGGIKRWIASIQKPFGEQIIEPNR